MSVVVDKVVLGPDEQAPDRVQIWGHFVRTGGRVEGRFGAPVYGYLHLGAARGREQQCRDEWARWQEAAGSGRAVAVGCRWDAENFLKLPVRKPADPVRDPDGAHATGQIGPFGDLYPKGRFDDLSHVEGLVGFAKRRP